MSKSIYNLIMFTRKGKRNCFPFYVRERRLYESEFKEYRKTAFKAIRELLVHKPRYVNYYVSKAKETKSENELSRVLAEVREII